MSSRTLIHHFFYWIAACLIVSCRTHHENNAAPVADNKGKDSTQKIIDTKTIASIKNARQLLQDGDLVTRSDNDFESLTLQNFSNEDRSYSHSGIAFKEDSGFVVFHSMTGTENPSGLCRKDPFDSFVNPVRKTGFGIFRYQLSTKEKEKFHSILQENINKKIPFDVTFNLKSNDSLYCSEMISKGLKASTGGRIVLPTSVLNNFTPKLLGYKYKQVFLKKYEYISIDNLYLNKFCKEVIRVTYQ